MEHNVSDSLLFLGSARIALREVIRLNENMDKDAKTALCNFVINEATDYQVISMVMDGEVPEEKYNDIAEAEVFARFRETVVENYAEISEWLGKKLTMNLLYEVGPISGDGLSSAVPVLEFLTQSGYLEEKSPKDMAFDAQFKARALKKRAAYKAGKAKKAVVGAAKKGVEGAKKAAGKVADKASAAKFDAQFKGRALKKQAAHKGAKVSSAARGAVASGKKAVAAGVEKGKNAAFDAQVKARGMKKAAGAHLRGAKADMGKAGQQMGKAGKSVGGAVKSLSKVPGAKAMAATAALATAIYAGTKVYKNYFSKAAQSCKGAADKAGCMAKARQVAVKAQIAATQKGAAACAKSKDPAKCKAGIQARVAKLQNKLRG